MRHNKKRPYNCDKIGEIVSGITHEEYKKLHAENPDDPRCRLGEHVRDFVRLDWFENKHNSTQVDVMTSICLKLIELDSRSKAASNALHAVSETVSNAMSSLNDATSKKS